MPHEYNHDLILRAQEMRSSMTPQEEHLWFGFLRNYPVRFRRQAVNCRQDAPLGGPVRSAEGVVRSTFAERRVLVRFDVSHERGENMTRGKPIIQTIAFIAVSLCFFSACHAPADLPEAVHINDEIGTFSYDEDLIRNAGYIEYWNSHQEWFESFNNVTESVISNKEDAICLAKNEVIGYDYNQISASYDDTCDMWVIGFGKRNCTGGVCVYLTGNGLTTLIVWGE